MSATTYALQHRQTLLWWTGGEHWSPFQDDARTFLSMTDSYLAAYTECQGTEPGEYEARPVGRSEAA